MQTGLSAIRCQSFLRREDTQKISLVLWKPCPSNHISGRWPLLESQLLSILFESPVWSIPVPNPGEDPQQISLHCSALGLPQHWKTYRECLQVPRLPFLALECVRNASLTLSRKRLPTYYEEPS